MIKEYRNVSSEIVVAEQFDGSDEMIEKYDIKKTCTVYMNKGPMYKLYKIKGLIQHDNLFNSDWIVTSQDGECWVVRDDIFKKAYQEVIK